MGDILWLVINLHGSDERLRLMRAQAERLRLPLIRVPAVCKKSLSPRQRQEAARRHCFKRPLTDGELACGLSHRKAMRQFLDSPQRYCVLLEDDAVLADDIAQVVQAAVEANEAGGPGWDLLKLDGARSCRFVHRPLGAGHELVEYFFEPPPSAMAVVMRREFAEFFLRASPEVSRPIDEDYKHHWQYGFRLKSVHPALARPANVCSEIGCRSKLVAPQRNAAYMLRLIAGLCGYYLRAYGLRDLGRILLHGRITPLRTARAVARVRPAVG
ncbi:glycosyltransferase family 25 protein [Stagnimonas aquatica]|uniref:Glycosyltransferase family 25 protein n=1 Tax=Stagnimonas aquatica TaxID=2689987 RepID=A0A3N0VIP8_9GAMM|nr:glycosyltransferase family 25 protein [Stagnimonas aquatica]ROH92088.1 glycosyltransferase family 25 protein [Stagnimonas aquatica]